MPAKRISINESQLRTIVRRMVNEAMATQPHLDLDTPFNDAYILYNSYADNPGPATPIRGYNEKIARSLLDSVEWEFIQYEGIIMGSMSAEVEGTADDGNLAVGQMYALIYVNPQTRTVEKRTRMWSEDCVALEGGKEWEPISGAEVCIDEYAIAQAINDALRRFVKGGGLDEYIDEDY
ncbi:MAG: hypothetical protein LUD72_07865 [Bacteroidales bacterium]|nr:hypothetical protein [Bacteroidales bacterium]